MSIFSHPVDVDAFNASQRGGMHGAAPAMSAERFARHVEWNSIHLLRCRPWTLRGELSGIALVGLRSERAWLGGFGVVPEFRARGLGWRYLQDVLSICRDADAQTLELEVLVQNAPAIALYKRGGFALVDELVVWSRAPLRAGATAPMARARDEREITGVARTSSTCWQREPQSVAAASPSERIVIGEDAAPQAYAFLRRDIDRATLLDVGARDTASAELLLDALDAVVPQFVLTLINEPAHGPLHQAFMTRSSWSETTRQHRMRRFLNSL